jgi:hypothetical protein
MTDDLTVPALFTVLVGDDPVRRVAVGGNGSRWEMWEGPGLGWYTTESVVHDVRPLIPEGTPVERVVVLPEDKFEVRSGGAPTLMCGGNRAQDAEHARLLAAIDLRSAAWFLKIAEEFDRRDHAARSAEPTPECDHDSQWFDDRWRCLKCGATTGAEPTPDPLAQARERERVDAVVRTVCPCTCEAAYYERNLTMPGCLWHDGGEDVSLLLQEAGLLAATEGGAS